MARGWGVYGMRNKEEGWFTGVGEMVANCVVTVLGQPVASSLHIWPDVFSVAAQSPDPTPAKPPALYEHSPSTSCNLGPGPHVRQMDDKRMQMKSQGERT